MTLREKIEKFFRGGAGVHEIRVQKFNLEYSKHIERERKRYHEALARHKEALARYYENERLRQERERTNSSGYRTKTPSLPRLDWTPMRFH